MSILDEVADIRILALGYVSKNVYNKIKKYCNENERFVRKNMKEYGDYLEKEFKENKPNFLDDFNFHDRNIKLSMLLDNDLILYLNGEDGNFKINKIIFKDVKIIKQDSELINSQWLYAEVYKNAQNYEIHVLISDAESKLGYLTFKCSNVQYECKDRLLFNSNIILKKDMINNVKEAIEQGLDIMNSMPSVINVSMFNNLVKIKSKIYLNAEIDKLYQKIVDFLEKDEEKDIVLNGYNSFIEMKLNSCDDKNDVMMRIKFSTKDSNDLSEAEFYIKTEKCLLKLFANDILELNHANYGYEIYLNGLHKE